MRTLAIGDIHGGLRGLTQIIDRAHVNSEDALIFLGDYVDGWSDSAQVIQYLIELSKTNTCVFIKGNHDVWCEQWLASGIINDVWFKHGGKETIESYDGFSKDQKLMHLDFFEGMPLYHLDTENRLFVHAGFTSMYRVERELHKENFYFDRTLWEMALTMDKNIEPNSKIYPNRLKHYSEIYIGHTPTINFGEDQPMNCGNIWNVDTGATFTGKLSAIDIDTKEVFQSDKVMDLYSDELGRNKK
ncbi:metallophosphoesterase family protein [Winogradskyella thalassocola]|uniref:Serine/threonine protein phosphatase 1 n=1 Tax=Winogradskyella thalassocola TaxID=262004 RepID=A0A1G7YGB8_9FLAO|nr:metallophosphoesterase family protein [Winogradskyella thalassocola]SDG95588.1 serine/threonine protein phosphatase 1 [Winogradskyella thalassocola]